eukprot:gene57054-biopygen72925
MIASNSCFLCEEASAGDGDVYDECAAGLVAAARAGRRATLFAFGQTGSGKTHTVRGILRPGTCGEESPMSRPLMFPGW